MVLWLTLAAAIATLEVVGFVDAKDNWPTASQLIKQYRRKHPWVRRTLLLLTFAVGPFIYLHLIAEVF